MSLCAESMVYGEPLLPRVVSAKPLAGYQIYLVFNNGERKRFDASGLLAYPAFKNLPEVFPFARVDYGTVVWPGDMDVSPDTLYLRSVPIDE